MSRSLLLAAVTFLFLFPFKSMADAPKPTLVLTPVNVQSISSFPMKTSSVITAQSSFPLAGAFGYLAIGTAATQTTFQGNYICTSTLYSCGTATLNSITLQGPGDFTIATNTCNGVHIPTIPPGGTSGPLCAFVVQFRPSVVGYEETVQTILATGTTQDIVRESINGHGYNSNYISRINSRASPQCPVHSSVNLDAMTLQEEIPLTGVPFTLNYSSDLVRWGNINNLISLGLGGWTPSLLHHYNITEGVLYFGNGQLRSLTAATLSDGSLYATDQDGTEVYYFTSAGVHTSTRDALTGIVKTTFGYDSSGRLASIADQFQNTTTFTYDISHPGTTYVTMTSPYGQQTMLQLDSGGHLISVQNPNHEVYTVTVYPNGQISTFTKPMGQQSSVTYDSSGNLVRDQGAGGDYLALSLLSHTDTNQELKTSTASGIATSYVTSVLGTTVSTHAVTSADGGTANYYNSDTGLNKGQDKYGNVFFESAAADPRFTKLATYSGSSSYHGPNSLFNITSQTTKSVVGMGSDPLTFTSLSSQTVLMNNSQKTYSSVYTAANKQLVSTLPSGNTTTEIFNANAQPASIQIGNLLPVSFGYDSKGRISSMNQGSRTSSLSYDGYSNVATSTNALSQMTSYQYDASNRMTLQTLPTGNAIAYTWDQNGNLTSITPPGKTAHSFTYNLFEHLGQYLPPAISSTISGATIYTYNVDGKLSQVNLPSGVQIGYNYGSTSGLLNQIATGATSYNYTYVPNTDLVYTASSPDNETLTYAYEGNIPKQIVTTGSVASTVNFGFNTDGTISQVQSTSANSSPTPIVFAYDNDGLLATVGDEWITRNSFGAVVTSSILNGLEVIGYNSYGEMTSDQYLTGTTASTGTITYTRDNLGRLTSTVSNIPQRAENLGYTYDTQGRLTTVTGTAYGTHTYTYDANSNRIKYVNSIGTTTATYDNQDRLTAYGTYVFGYDDNGNQTSKSLLHNGKITSTTNYTYDAFGDLTSATFSKGKVTKNVIKYLYDAQRRRVGKLVNNVLVKGYIYRNQTQLIAELDGSGNITRQYVYGTKSNIPDIMIANGKEYRIMSDQVGTPKLLIDSATGAVVKIYAFDEFGYVSLSSTADDMFGKDDVQIAFGFAGGIFDKDTGFVHFGARDYDPYTGRWLSKDPILFNGQDTNLYGYVLSDPINKIDPSGKSWVGIIAAAICGAYDVYGFIQSSRAINNLQNQINDINKQISSLDPSADCDKISSLQQKQNQLTADLTKAQLQGQLQGYGTTAICAGLSAL
jgi:RHS repeat-associated protein